MFDLKRFFERLGALLIIFGVLLIFVAVLGLILPSAIPEPGQLKWLAIVGVVFIAVGIPIKLPTSLFLQRIFRGPATASIKGVTIEHNVYQDSKKGMIVCVHFRISGRRGIRCKVVTFFYYASGKPLADTNGKRRTKDGKVCTSEKFTPKSQDVGYGNFKIFMPYSELHLPKGKHALKLDVSVYDPVKGEYIATSDYYSFRYTKKG